MKFEFEIGEEDLKGYLNSIIKDKMKNSVAQRLANIMDKYWVPEAIREEILKQIKKQSEELIPQLLQDKPRMDEIAQEAVTSHMMAKIKRNIKKMEQS